MCHRDASQTHRKGTTLPLRFTNTLLIFFDFFMHKTEVNNIRIKVNVLRKRVNNLRGGRKHFSVERVNFFRMNGVGYSLIHFGHLGFSKTEKDGREEKRE